MESTGEFVVQIRAHFLLISHSFSDAGRDQSQHSKLGRLIWRVGQNN